MNTPATIDPAALLQAIEDCCNASAASLPNGAEVKDEWSSVAFRVGGHNLLACLGEVIETLEYPPLTQVPNTSAWVHGIANVRGKLLPIVDLNAFLGNAPASISPRTRVLVLDCDGFYSGLVVDEVFGLKHFPETNCRVAPEIFDTSLGGYVTQGFYVDDSFWGIFSFTALAGSPQFLKTAV